MAKAPAFLAKAKGSKGKVAVAAKGKRPNPFAGKETPAEEASEVPAFKKGGRVKK